MKEARRIICLGDSITYGYPYGPRASWVALAGGPGLGLINRGLNGDTTAGMLRRLKADVIDRGPMGAVILGGTNDAFLGRVASEYQSNVRKIISALCRAGIHPVLGTVTPIHPEEAGRILPGQDLQIKKAGQLLDEYRRWLRSWARDREVPLIDFAAALSGQETASGPLLVDGVHPSREGYRLMAAEAQKVLSDLFTT